MENAWEVKKSKFENHIKWGSKICQMMRGFQIWHRNSNQITFDPFFGQKNDENWQKPFFGQKGGQMLSDLNSNARFGILSSFGIF